MSQSPYASQPIDWEHGEFPAGIPGPSQPPPPPPSAKRRSALPWVIGGVVLLLIIVAAGVGGVLFLRRGGGAGSTQSGPVDPAVVNGLGQKPLTDADVAGIDRTQAFWAYVLLTAQQHQSVATSEVHIVSSGINSLSGQGSTSDDFFKVGFDYGTKKIVYSGDHHYGSTPRETDQLRCYDGKQIHRHTVEAGVPFVSSPITTHDECVLGEAVDLSLGDCVIPGGLTADQAGKFIQYLRAQPGLVTVDGLALLDHQGKQYLHFTVNLNPVTGPNSAGVYLGTSWLTFAFRETGLDFRTHPYQTRGTGGAGLHMEYYIDPTTKLPAYSEIKTTPSKDHNGSYKPEDESESVKMQYQYGVSTFDASDKSPDLIAITW
jgi:hypothetical protein